MLTSALVLNLWDLLSKSDGSAEAGGGGLGVAWKACGSKFLVVNKVDLLESLRRRGLEYSSFGALCEVLLQNNFCEDDLVPGVFYHKHFHRDDCSRLPLIGCKGPGSTNEESSSLHNDRSVLDLTRLLVCTMTSFSEQLVAVRREWGEWRREVDVKTRAAEIRYEQLLLKHKHLKNELKSVKTKVKCSESEATSVSSSSPCGPHSKHEAVSTAPSGLYMASLNQRIRERLLKLNDFTAAKLTDASFLEGYLRLKLIPFLFLLNNKFQRGLDLFTHKPHSVAAAAKTNSRAIAPLPAPNLNAYKANNQCNQQRVLQDTHNVSKSPEIGNRYRRIVLSTKTFASAPPRNHTSAVYPPLLPKTPSSPATSPSVVAQTSSQVSSQTSNNHQNGSAKAANHTSSTAEGGAVALTDVQIKNEPSDVDCVGQQNAPSEQLVGCQPTASSESDQPPPLAAVVTQSSHQLQPQPPLNAHQSSSPTHSLSPQKVVASKKRPYAVLESSSATNNNNNSRVAAAKKPSSSGNVAFLRHCVDKVFPAYSPTPAVLQPQLAAKSEHPARRMALPPAPPPQSTMTFIPPPPKKLLDAGTAEADRGPLPLPVYPYILPKSTFSSSPRDSGKEAHALVSRVNPLVKRLMQKVNARAGMGCSFASLQQPPQTPSAFGPLSHGSSATCGPPPFPSYPLPLSSSSSSSPSQCGALKQQLFTSTTSSGNLLAAPNPFIPMMRDNSLHPTGTAPIPPAAVFSSALRRSHPPSAVAAWLQKQSAAAAAAAAISCAAPSPTQQISLQKLDSVPVPTDDPNETSSPLADIRAGVVSSGSKASSLNDLEKLPPSPNEQRATTETESTKMDEDRSHGATFTACTSTSSTANGSGGGGGGATGVQVKEEKEDKDVDHFLMHF